MLLVKNWDKIFENNRTRELKKMDWVPLPNKLDGDGYTDLMSREGGHELFAAWVLIVQVASKCGNPAGMRDGPEGRGKLTRDGVRPHDSESLSRITRAPKRIFDEAIPILLEIGWLEEISQLSAGIPQEDAPRVYARREGNGSEENGTLSEKNVWKTFTDPVERLFGRAHGIPAETERGRLIPELERIGATPEELEKRVNHYRLCWPNAAVTLYAILKHWETIPTLKPKNPPSPSKPVQDLPLSHTTKLG